MTLPWITGNEIQRSHIEFYLKTLREAGYSEKDRDVFVMYPIYIGETDKAAGDDAKEAWNH